MAVSGWEDIRVRRISITTPGDITIAVGIIGIDIAAVIEIPHFEMQVGIIVVRCVTPIEVLQQHLSQDLAARHYIAHTHRHAVRIEVTIN